MTKEEMIKYKKIRFLQIVKEEYDRSKIGGNMGEYNFCDEIKERYHIEELDSETLRYRINGFVNACKMNLDGCISAKGISITRTPYISIENDEDGLVYDIKYFRNYKHRNGKSCVLSGKYNDIDFVFTNYFNRDRNKNRINEIPFSISLSNDYDGTGYFIGMVTTIDTMVQFIIMRFNEKQTDKIVFYSSIDDFSSVLKIVRLFVENPEKVFNIYRDIMNEKEVIFTRGELNKALSDADELDKPKVKTRKKIK